MEHILGRNPLNSYLWPNFPVSFYLFKVNNRNSRKRCEICSKLTTKIPKRRHRHRSSVFIFNVQQFLHHSLVFLLFTVSMYLFSGLIEVKISTDDWKTKIFGFLLICRTFIYGIFVYSLFLPQFYLGQYSNLLMIL